MNQTFKCYLAQGGGAPPLGELSRSGKLKSPLGTETMMILGLGLGLGLALFAWAFFFRKRRPNDPHRQVIEAGSMKNDGAPAQGGHHGHRRHRHRRRQSSHSHRNPTLQETGGLPPLRPEDQAPPY